MREKEKLHEAILFAAKAHKGQVRKGTTVDYLVHPMEVLQILTSIGADNGLLLAGALHDTVEDSEVSLDELGERFGADAASLVGGHTEDKKKSWEERKRTLISAAAEGGKRLKMLVLADLLSNLRSTWYDYKEVGDAVWERFRAPKEKQSWYYSALLDAVAALEKEENTEEAYWEATELYKNLYVRYYLDEGKKRLYQAAAHGEGYVMAMGYPQWKKMEGTLPKEAGLVSREAAEQMEDECNYAFWARHEADMEDGTYRLFSSDSRWLDIRIRDKKLSFDGDDFGEACKRAWGTDAYEFHYSLDEENTRRFLIRLRACKGNGRSLKELFMEEFGCDGGPERFTECCRKWEVTYQFFCF